MKLSPNEMGSAHLLELGLTPREAEVLRWMVQGKRDREIASILNLSPRTVEKHAYNLFKKLNVETRTAAANHCWYILRQRSEFSDSNGSTPG